MQSDSVQFSTFEHLKESSNQAVAHSNRVRSYNCIKCPLIFKSKVYLYEHLNKVHCLDVDAALKGAGLKYAESHTTAAENRRSFECQHCDFKTFHKDVLKRHEKQCQKTENHNFVETVVISEDPESEVLGGSTNQCNEAAEAAKDPLSRAKCAPKISKDIKTYKRPQQTITKFFAAASGSSKDPHAKLVDDDTKGALILQETSSSCSPSSSGVSKVSAKSLIDISISGTHSHKFLQNAEILTTDNRAPEHKDRYKELHNNAGNSTNSSIAEGPPAKKIKLGKEEATLPEENAFKPSPVSTDFSFEVSEDEEEKKLHLDNKDSSKPNVYSCKHCDYIDGSFRRMTSHYHIYHPYIRCNAAYIQLPNDQGASFRCLECPVEFLSTADLKLHYTEKHPEAADVFKMKLNDFSLVFKCFSCPFTTNLLQNLREHYKEKHPAYNLNKPLLFCQYSESKCQDESTLVKTHEKMSSSKNSRDISPEKTSTSCKEDKSTLSPQHPTSNGPNVTLYKCSNCGFMHKSAVVMHVHYQKKHPDKAITIDKIKQSVHDASRRIPEKTKDKSELSLHKRSTLSLPKHTADASKKPSEVSTTKPVESVQDKTTMTTSSKCKRETIPGLDNTSSSSKAKLYYCQFCSYTSSEIRSVLGHHFARHSMQPSITMKDIFQYSATVRKKLVKSQTQSKARQQSKISTNIETDIEEDGAEDVSENQSHAAPDAENLFFCQKCNYGNSNPQGVINHQVKAHPAIITNNRLVMEHTALVREQLKNSNSNRKSSSSSKYLPLPILNDGDEDKFFCDLCNYRHTTMAQVLSHYSKMHNSCANKAADLHQYTAMVLKQAPKSSTNQEQLEKKKSNKPAAPSSVGVAEIQRKLKCYICAYSTQYVSVLKAHMRKIHNSNRSVSDILGVCFRQGLIEAGYHCEWCVFSHKNSKVVYNHYQEHHPDCTASLDYVRNQLCVGLNKLQLKKKKLKLKSAHLGNDTDSSQTSKSSGQNDSETYSCTMCSFQSSSKSGLACHKNEAHLTLAEDNKSNPSKNKGASVKSQLEDLNEMPGVFESFQMPLEDQDEAKQISTVFKCSSCPATFISQHGLNVHCGMKHLELINMEESRKQVKSQMHVHVFKCPHCTYVNTVYQGILAHCQMKHPDFESRADSLHVDLVHLYNRDKYIKRHESGETLKFKGHMCKTCPKICATLHKLNSHCERDHSDNLPSMPKLATEPSAVSKIKLTKPHSFDKSVWKASLLCKTKKFRVKCQHCTYSCSSKVGLSRHMQKQHMDMFPKDSVYKCPLCHLFYFRQHLLGRHIAKRHGKAAYSKYYVPVYKEATKKPVSSSQDIPSPQQQQNNSTEDKRLVYKCPKCPYVNVTHHGVLTHCQMKHPLFEARTRKLEMGEILVSDIVRCSNGKGTYERGYLCKRCPQIHPSLIKLKNHCKMEHRKIAASELSAETEAKNPDVDDPPDSTPEDAFIETAQANVTEASPSLCTLKTSESPSLQNKDKWYKCQLCTYATSSRAYLWKHYKNVHKLNSASRCKLLQKYNKRNCNYLRLNAEHKRTVKCEKCPDLVLDSSQSLIDHYNTFHRLGYKSDFTVISLGVKRKKSTGVYRCAHCLKKLNGTRNLRVHLDHHRAVMKKMAMETQKKASPVGPSLDPKPIELCRQDEVSVTESMEELAQQNETPEEDVRQPSSPQASTSNVTEAEPDAEVTKDRFPCKQCHRFFRSLKGLRSHERSHALMAAIKNLDNLSTAELKHDIKKCIFYKTGTRKPFRCSCCSYKTNLMGLMQSHILKNHQDIIQRDNVETSSNDEEISQEVEKESSDSSEKNNLPELDDEPEEIEETLYLEPADVQRQLNHYSLMAQITDKTSTSVLELTLPENCLLQCEMCNFNTEHLSSIRRHYLNRHGKKMLRCKDCEFFTCSRKTLEMHVQMGHSTCQSEPTHQKDLRCPFCLYQTKNKNNMIDHIVLHREERVVPVEVRRPKLSRYLQGIVFRCHRCTFSSGSNKNLRLHMMRHDDLKPYQCRLCYFDCTRLADLEAHLSDKHQVLRNHELVGQVNLDQLEARIGRMLENNDEFNTDNEEMETEEFSSDFAEVPQTNSVAEYDTERRTATSEEAQEEQEHDENEESPAKSSVSDIRHDDAQPNPTLQKRHEQDLQTQEVNVALHLSASQIVIKIEQNPNECNNKHTLSEGCSGPEKEEQMTKYPSRLTDDQKEKAAESSSCFRMTGLAHANKLHIKEIQQRSMSIDAKIEDDIVRHVLLLDESGSKSHKWENQKQAVKMELNAEAKNRGDDASLDKEDSATLAQNPRIQATSDKMNYAQANNIRAEEGFRFERQLQTPSPSYKQLNLNYKDSVCLTNCKQEQKQTPETYMDVSEPCREMPVLEKEDHIEEQQLLETCKEEEETDKLELKQEEEVEMMTEDETQYKKQEMSDIHNGEMATRGGAAEVLHTEKLFTCVLCGRNLMNIFELNRHVMRHKL